MHRGLTYRYTSADTIGKNNDILVYRAIFDRYFAIQPTGGVDLIIHISDVNPDELKSAPLHILMVNHEFTFDDLYCKPELLPRVHYFLCKTHIGLNTTQQVIREQRLPGTAVMLGFTSPFTIHECKRDWNRFLHLGGRSPLKNTAAVLNTWIAHPEYPELTVICREGCAEYVVKYRVDMDAVRRARNIRYLERVDEPNRLQCEIGIHLCPSMMEGYGHYINEARASGALVVTSDLPPMNELVDNDSGMLVTCQRVLAKPYNKLVNVQSCWHGRLDTTIQRIIAMPVEQRMRLGARARERYAADTRTFERRCDAFANGLANRIKN